MSDINKQIDDILKECVEVCADCITCFDTDEYIEISDKRWLGKGPNGYYRNQIKALISTAVREAREREINDFSNSMASELGEDDSMIVIRSYRNHRLAQLKEGVQE